MTDQATNTTTASGSPLDRVVRLPAPMRAWKIFVRGWGDAPQGVNMARTRGRAIARSLTSAQDAGYALKWGDFRAVRSPEHDCLFERHGMFSWSWDHAQAILCADQRPNAELTGRTPVRSGSATG